MPTVPCSWNLYEHRNYNSRISLPIVSEFIILHTTRKRITHFSEIGKHFSTFCLKIKLVTKIIGWLKKLCNGQDCQEIAFFCSV